MITITLTGENLQSIKDQMAEFLVETQEVRTTTSLMASLANDTAAAVEKYLKAPIEAPPAAELPKWAKEFNAESDRLAAKPVEEIKPFQLEVQKKRTRRTKEQLEAKEPAVAAPEAPPIQPISAPQGYSKQHVHEALQQVNVAVGLPKSREILTSFGCNRISEIKEEQFKAFVEKCNEVVMLQG